MSHADDAWPIKSIVTNRPDISYNTNNGVNNKNLISVTLKTPSLHNNPIAIPRLNLESYADFYDRKGLGFIHINVCSILSKLDNIKIMVLKTNADIFIFSETWLDSNTDDKYIALDGYNVYRTDRVRRTNRVGPTTGGGIAIYVKNHISVSVALSLSRPKCFEYLALTLSIGNTANCEKLLLIGVYRQPKAKAHAIEKIFDLVSSHGTSEILFMGDINLDWLTNASNSLKNLCNNLDLHQLITVPTRPNIHNLERASLLDIILTNKPHKYKASGVFSLDFSDHCPIACIRDTRQHKTQHRVIVKINFKCFNEESFIYDLSVSNLQDIFSFKDPHLALNHFIYTFNSIADKHAPFKKIRVKNRRNPWFSSEISLEMRARDKAWKTARSSGFRSDWQKFHLLRNKCLNMIRKAKSAYYISTLSDCSGNPGKFWSTVKSLSQTQSSSLPNQIKTDSSTISNKGDLCNIFNEHFITAGHLLGTSGSPTNYLAHDRPNPVKFSLRLFSGTEVREALYTIDPKKSTGADELDPQLLVLASPIISDFITHIFNLTLITDSIPSLWKTAHVSPLHKGGPTDDLNNYRPISKLPCLAKILELLVNNQLKYYLSLNNILNCHQSGFRPRHSTTTAATKVINDIVHALDNKQDCVALFIDLSKAFDSVNHVLLLKRLAEIGLDHKSCNWFKNYLSGRSQAVVADGHTSTFLNLSKGVPQGSILAPILFTLFINDFNSGITNSAVHLYADDTVIYSIAPSVNLAFQNLQSDFHIIQQALINLKLSLNAGKTKYMVFTRKLNSPPTADNLYTIEGVPIEKVSNYKYLGVWIDDKLSFKKHISELITKIKPKLAFLYRNKACFDSKSRKQLIQATILSVLDYCDTIYMHAAHASLKPLDAIYHSALRFITGDKFLTHHCRLYEKVGWPSLTIRRNQHCNIFIYKGLLKLLPNYLNSLLEPLTGHHHTRSQDFIVLETPTPKSELGKTAFCFYGPNMWNCLQSVLKLKNLISLDCFKILVMNTLNSEPCNCIL